MIAVWARARAELRTRWRSWLGLALLVGLAAGLVMAAAAGARRTDSAYSRFNRDYLGFDVMIQNTNDPGVAQIDPARIVGLPQVVAVARGQIQFASLGEGVPMFIPADNTVGTLVNRFKLLQGRLPVPSRSDEVLVNFVVAGRFHLQVGSKIPLITSASIPDPKLYQRFAALLHRAGVPLLFTVVGVEATPGEFPPATAIDVHGTPALHRAVGHLAAICPKDFCQPQLDSALIRLRHGVADVPAFRSAVARLSGGKPIPAIDVSDVFVSVQRSIHLQALALWLLAALVAVAAGLIFSQTLARQTSLDSDENTTLWALGMTGWQLFALGIVRAAVVGAAGAIVAVVLAFLLSPLMPTGLARIAEPNPGLRPDALVAMAGAGLTIVVVVLLAAIPAWRSARVRTVAAAGAPGDARSSRAVTVLAGLGAPPSAVAGVRLALEPGRGRTAVPVRTTVLGVALGVAAMTASFTFATSLNHLLITPRLYGLAWDLDLAEYPRLGSEASAIVRSTPGVAGFAIGVSGLPLLVDGQRVDSLSMDPIEGAVLPPIVDGQAPRGPGEVALGTRTLQRLDVHIGETVTVVVPGSAPARLRVVGSALLPPFRPEAGFGTGALISNAAFHRLSGGVPVSDIYIRLAPGADRAAVVRTVSDRLEHAPSAADMNHPGVGTVPVSEPTDIVNFGRVQNMPLVLGAVLALIAVGTLAHTVVSSVRRRRRDLAILKTIGFLRRQVSAAIAWQATTFTGIALLIGIPVGVIIGRWMWGLLISQLGGIDETVIAISATLLTIPAALLLANLIAAAPARIAARTKPAIVLRSE